MENHSIAVFGSFWGDKHFFLLFVPFYRFDQKDLFKQKQISLRIHPFSNVLRKLTLWVFLYFFLRESIFWLKREVFCKFDQNASKQQKIIVQLYVDQFGGKNSFTGLIKKVVWTNPNFPLDSPLFKLFMKNKLSEYFCASFWDKSYFWLKRKVFSEFPRKCSKTTENLSLAVCDAFLREIFFLLILIHLTALTKNCSLNKSIFSSGFVPFQIC